MADIITRALVAANKKSLPLPRFISSFFLEKTVRLDVEDIDLQEFVKKARVARYVNPMQKARGTELLYFERKMFKLPTAQDLQTITGNSLKGVVFGENMFTATPPADKLAMKLMDVIQEQAEMVDTNIELAAIDIATTGYLTVLGEGEDRRLDFMRPASLSIDVGETDLTRYFDHVDSDIPEEITAIIVEMGENGSTLTDLVGRGSLMSLVVAGLKAEGEFDTDKIAYGSLEFDNRLAQDGTIYHGTYKHVKLWSYSAKYTDENKVDQRGMPEDKLLGFAASNQNITAYGYFPDIESLLPNATGIQAAMNEVNMITKVSAGNGGAKVEVVHTVAPLLADPTSTIAVKIIA